MLTVTTDVQMVTARLKKVRDNKVIATVQCVFIMGSNARGCMVVLKSLYGKESQILTRNKTTNLAMSTITLNYVQSCYHGVEAFDIESDDTVGSLAVPGMIYMRRDNTKDIDVLCSSLIASEYIYIIGHSHNIL